MSPNRDEGEQRRVVWSRLHNHRANLANRLATTRERYLAARRALNPRTTQVESSHDPLYRDKVEVEMVEVEVVVVVEHLEPREEEVQKIETMEQS